MLKIVSTQRGGGSIPSGGMQRRLVVTGTTIWMDEAVRQLVFSSGYWGLRQVMWEGRDPDLNAGWKE